MMHSTGTAVGRVETMEIAERPRRDRDRDRNRDKEKKKVEDVLKGPKLGGSRSVT